MKEEKKETVDQKLSEEKQESTKQKNATHTPTSSEEMIQNFRQNSGSNTEDIKTAPDGRSDYH